MNAPLRYFLMRSPRALQRMLLLVIAFSAMCTAAVDIVPFTALFTSEPRSSGRPIAAHSTHSSSRSTGSANSLAPGSVVESSSPLDTAAFEIKTPGASDSNTSIVVLVAVGSCVAAAVAAFICVKMRKEAALASFEERWLGTPRESINAPVQAVVIDVHAPVDAVRAGGGGGLSPTFKCKVQAFTPEPQSPVTKIVASNWV